MRDAEREEGTGREGREKKKEEEKQGPLGGGVLRGGHSAPEREDVVFYVLDRCSQLLTAILSRQDQVRRGTEERRISGDAHGGGSA